MCKLAGRAVWALLVLCGVVQVARCGGGGAGGGRGADKQLNFRSNKFANIAPKHMTYTSFDTYRNQIPKKITFPVVIHVDPFLLRHYVKLNGSKARTELTVLAEDTIARADRLLSHPSLGHKLKLRLLEVRFLKDNPGVVNATDFASDYLRSYCDWQATKKRRDKMRYSILLTGLDLFYWNAKGKKVFENHARSYRNSACHVGKSCVVAEGSPRHLDHVLAHEISHSLGIHHDGDGNKCSRTGHMMAPQLDPRRLPTTWSACSAVYLRAFLRSKMAWCLR